MSQNTTPDSPAGQPGARGGGHPDAQPSGHPDAAPDPGRPPSQADVAATGAGTGAAPRRAPLDATGLTRRLVDDSGAIARLDVVESTGSTNTDLAAAFAADPGNWPDLSVLATDFQSAGKGRLERSWQAPPRSSLAVSILFRPSIGGSAPPQGAYPWLSMLCALALAESLETAAGVDARLKWPNDVVVDGRKVSGVLARFVPAGALPGALPGVVVGAGVNVSLTAGELPVPTATSLLLAGARTTDTTVLLEAYLRAAAGLYRGFLADGADADGGEADGGGRRDSLRARVAARMATLGASVRAELPGGSTLEGTAVGLDAHGGLQVRTADGGVATVTAGDVVHVRRTDGRYA